MINGRLPSTAISGYYEYLSQMRQRVNITPHETSNNEESTTKITAITAVEEDRLTAVSSTPTTEILEKSSTSAESKDVTKWTSADVQQWAEAQSEKYELKKATSENFQMNGQALVLLTKHDFLRRSPDGGEILYYAFQRLINPNKANAKRTQQSLIRPHSSGPNPMIVELDSDNEEPDSTLDSSVAQPIVEEPDDPPAARKPEPDAKQNGFRSHPYSHAFVYGNAHVRPPVFTMPANTYYHPQYQQQAFSNAYVYAQPHVHTHMPQTQFYHPQAHQHTSFFHQYHPMMSAQGILIEVVDTEETTHVNGADASMNGNSADNQEQLYLITMNGQRQVMSEDQVRQLMVEVHQQQMYQQQQQQQQFQQQQFQQQQFQQSYQQPQPHSGARQSS